MPLLCRHMLVPLALALASWVALAPTAYAADTVDVKGARFETQLESEGQAYQMIGHGLFRYMIWNAYAGAYYQPSDQPEAAPLSDVPRRLELEYFHAIEADDFAGVTRDSVRERLGDAAYRELLPTLNAFTRAYQSVEPGDRYALTWNGDALTLALNGQRVYEGDDPQLARALFAIWLGDQPLKESFRNDLLGRR
ncbi:hypothetical protein C1H70_02715 [Halomonas urumqiensis]|uniref:Chalcone isomerase domain-containing protein n=2 Tax=Halomonas urumqiensis TaxID=1684789 RepID=A0A2N7UPB2_9GAMM|nr:hypothetical protein C1H70_02715 [Halomonas urumqiensis]PTB02917.1 hypothetical protein C6V82_07750 [Halomonas urumqiensis]